MVWAAAILCAVVSTVEASALRRRPRRRASGHPHLRARLDGAPGPGAVVRRRAGDQLGPVHGHASASAAAAHVPPLRRQR